MTSTILRLPAVKLRTGLSRSALYGRVAEASFPKQIKLGPRTVGWLEHEVDAWIAAQIQRSRKGT